MKVSIIIPTYNRFNKLANLLNSLIPQIREHRLEENVEVLIVDDCSVPVIAERIKHLLDRSNCHFLRLFSLDRNRGQSFARNYGLSQSTKEHKIDIRQYSSFLAMFLGFIWQLSMKYWNLRDMMRMKNPFAIF